MLRRNHLYPWKIGAPSYVIPADLTANVSLLAHRVDAVQLLFFESSSNAVLAHPFEVKPLQEMAQAHDLTYAVHLPTDILLGDSSAAVRLQGLDEICRLVETLSPLAPFCYDLHLNPAPHQELNLWLDSLDSSLTILVQRLGRTKELVAIENIDYPYAMVGPLVAGHGFSRCLDLGHLKRYGHDLDEALTALASVRHIHFHGVRNGRDHGPILPEAAEEAVLLGEWLWKAEYQGVVTLEIYSLEKLEITLHTLERVWRKYQRSSA
jgi:sugar phosphate isomerase/epimerase